MFGLKDILIPKSTLGIEVCQTPNGVLIWYCILSKNKDEIFINECGDLNENQLVEFINDKKLPFRLHLSGKGILVDDSNEKINKDFYSQKTDTKTFLMRIDALSPIIQELLKSHLFSGLILGSHPIHWAKTYLNLNQTRTFCYSDLDDRPNWNLPQHNSSILGEQKDTKYHGSIISGLSIYFKEINSTATPLETEKFYLNFKQNRIFLTGVISFAIILVITMITQIILNSQIESKTKKLNYNLSLINKYKSLKDEYTLKSKLVSKLGFDTKFYLSFFADEIGKSVPSSITLNLLEIVTLNEENFKKNQILQFEKNRIKISGKTNSIVAFNNWLDVIKKFEWTKNVTVDHLEADTQSNNSNFNIEVIIQ